MNVRNPAGLIYSVVKAKEPRSRGYPVLVPRGGYCHLVLTVNHHCQLVPRTFSARKGPRTPEKGGKGGKEGTGTGYQKLGFAT